MPECFLKGRDGKPCDGRLVKAHLIPQRLLKREFPKGAWYRDGAWWPTLPMGADPKDFVSVTLAQMQRDPRSWVWVCGGPMGVSGHHGALDSARTVRLDRVDLPRQTETFAREFRLGWHLDLEYGDLPETGVAA